MVLGAGGVGKVSLGTAGEVLLIRSSGSIDCGCALVGGLFGEDVSTRAGEGITTVRVRMLHF
jgi:hypothetical protein